VRQSPLLTPHHIKAISFPEPGHGFLMADGVGFDTEILETFDGGLTWTLRSDINP
jgi:hypothetical protein